MVVSGKRKEKNGKREKRMTYGWWFLFSHSLVSRSLFISLRLFFRTLNQSFHLLRHFFCFLLCFISPSTSPSPTLTTLLFNVFLFPAVSILPLHSSFSPYYFLSSLVQRSAVMCRTTKCQSQNHFTCRTCILSIWKLAQILYVHITTLYVCIRVLQTVYIKVCNGLNSEKNLKTHVIRL